MIAVTLLLVAVAVALSTPLTLDMFGTVVQVMAPSSITTSRLSRHEVKGS
jgi:hypothetical protein